MRLLAAVPDDQSDYMVFGDIEAVLGHTDTDRPPPDGDAGDLVSALIGDGRQVQVPQLFQRPDATDDAREELGFSLLDAHQTLEAGQLPETVVVVAGRIDPDAVRKAATTFEPFAADVEVDKSDGFTVYRFGEELRVDPAKRTPLRPLGQGGRLTVRDGLALWVSTNALVDRAVVAAAGGPSAADLPEVAAVASALDDAGVYSCYLVGPEKFAGSGGLVPWRYAGVGVAQQGAERRFVVVLAHADADAARANAEALARTVAEGASLVTAAPWSERLSEVDIGIKGTAVVAVFDHDGKDALINVVPQRELIVFSS